MEAAEEQPPGQEEHIPPVNQDPELVGALVNSFVGFFQLYGWFILLGVVFLLFIRSRFQSTINQWQLQREDASYKKMDGGKAQERMEAMERARVRMQEQLDQQAKEFTEKQQKREEEKRQERLEDWERHQQGKGYRNKTKGTSGVSSKPASQAPSSSSGAGTSSQQPKKRLKPDYNPLMGNTGGDVCRFRPSPRGGASGGG